MKSRWLSTFTVIGIMLLVLSLIGFIMGPRFVYDPGQVSDGREPLYYCVIGALMVLNGLLSPPLPEEIKKADISEQSRRIAESHKAIPASDKPSAD